MTLNIDPQVFEKLGRAIFHAQVLEDILVSENLTLHSSADVLNEAAVDALEVELRTKSLGHLLCIWKRQVPEDRFLFQHLKDIVDDRNLLAHRLFRTPRFKSSEDYSTEILRICARIRTAQYLICAHNPEMTAELDAEWGISEDDRKD